MEEKTQSNRKSESQPYPSAISYQRTARTNQRCVQAEKATVIKIKGKNTAFIDDIKGTLKNTYVIVEESKVFYDVKDHHYYCYLSIQPQRSAYP